ncbi:MAG: 3'-5' exonuclease [Campylobacterales bacterium]|nr:3'-5' exonuclease [Campylobacterales bacterium]
MKYLDKLVNSLRKSPLSIKQFYHILSNNETFFDSVELETQLLLSNGLPIYFENDFVYLSTLYRAIEDQAFCIIDIETTAGSVQKGSLLEIGAVKFKNGKIIETYESLVNTYEIPQKVQEITGITQQMTSDAPQIKEVLEEFKIFLEDDVFVAHNISFDYKFLNDSLIKYNLGQLCNRKLCTIDLSHKTIKAERYGLQYLKEQFQIDIPNHHRALSDALSTTEIFKICLGNLPGNIKTTEQLIDFAK